MAVADYALASLDEVKAYLGVEDIDRDAILEGLIDDVSRTILDTTGREYAPQDPADVDDDDVDRSVAYRVGSAFIDLHPYEAREVSAIVVNDPDGTTTYELEAGEWQLRPIANRVGVYDRIHLSPVARPCSTLWDRMSVTITGRWGWPAVPADVRGWLLELVEDRFREDIAVFADADGDVSPTAGGSGGPSTIPFRIRDAMNRARRPYVGHP